MGNIGIFIIKYRYGLKLLFSYRKSLYIFAKEKMINMKRILIIISLLSAISLMFMGCEMIDYHPYDVNIRGERYINTKNIDKIEAKTKNKDTIRFALMGDTQNRYKETEDFANHINKQNNIDFVIHGGDITEYGMCDEFLLQRDIMNKLHIPYVVIM